MLGGGIHYVCSQLFDAQQLSTYTTCSTSFTRQKSRCFPYLRIVTILKTQH